MDDELWIGPARENDYYPIGLMHVAAYVECYGKFIDPKHLAGLDATGFMQIYFGLTRTEGQTIWVAKQAETPVAVAIFGPKPVHAGSSTDTADVDTGAGTGWIEALYVDYNNLNKGIGRQLLDQILEQMDFAVVALDCAKQNADGCAFWEKRGFRPVGDGRAHPVNGERKIETVRYVLERCDSKK